MKINRVIGKDVFYKEILELLRSIPPLNKLRPKEIDLLIEIIRQNDNNRDMSKDKRRIYIFSTENRKSICEILKCSSDTLNNNLSILRKHRLLNKNNELIPILDINSESGFDFNLNITIKK